jgi:hypothetical protein
MENFKNLPTALHAYNAGETRARARKTSAKEPRTAYTKHVIEEYKKSLIVLPEASKLYKEANFFHNQSPMLTEGAIALTGRSLLPIEWPGNVSKMCSTVDNSQSRLCGHKRIYLQGDLQCLIHRFRRPKSFPRFEKALVNASAVEDIWLEDDLKTRHKNILRI